MGTDNFYITVQYLFVPEIECNFYFLYFWGLRTLLLLLRLRTLQPGSVHSRITIYAYSNLKFIYPKTETRQVFWHWLQTVSKNINKSKSHHTQTSRD